MRGTRFYFVYENWTHDKAVVHEFNCGFCRPQTGKTANGQWHGSYSSWEAALAKAQSLKCRTARGCSHCIGWVK